ncbi:hypothetical protein [Fluviispira vulneris]|uniref:hypothetical protein n=1 Tax=Fluviispira vulneris TaxID=2763012 RepID=UPI001645B985|nr:hypothetical protein [Fluviispira vulneris]
MGIAGSLLAQKIIKMFSYGVVLLGGSFFNGVILLVIASLNLKSIYALAFLSGTNVCVISIIIVCFFTLRQKLIPKFYLGRVISITRMISFMAILISSIIAGYFMQINYTYQEISFISAIICFTSAVIGLKSPLYNKEKLEMLQTPLK